MYPPCIWCRYCSTSSPGPVVSPRGTVGLELFLHTNSDAVYSGFKGRYATQNILLHFFLRCLVFCPFPLCLFLMLLSSVPSQYLLFHNVFTAFFFYHLFSTFPSLWSLHPCLISIIPSLHCPSPPSLSTFLLCHTFFSISSQMFLSDHSFSFSSQFVPSPLSPTVSPFSSVTSCYIPFLLLFYSHLFLL